MEIVTKKRMMIFSGSTYPELAREVADHLGMRLGRVSTNRFANGELYARYEESVRGADVFVLQSHQSSGAGRTIHDAIVEHLVMIDALKRASAKRIIAVVPYYAYSRSNQKALPRQPISAKLLAECYEQAGVSRIMSVDLHTAQIQGFFSGPFDHLTALPLLQQWIAENVDEADRVVVAPDTGRVRLAERYAGDLDCPLAIVHRRRSRGEHAASGGLELVGEVADRTAIVVDDMIDTAGRLCDAAELLAQRGAASVIACATHPLFSPPAGRRLADSAIERLVVTDTVPIRTPDRLPGLVVLSIAPILASALRAVFEDESLSELFRGRSQ